MCSGWVDVSQNTCKSAFLEEVWHCFDVVHLPLESGFGCIVYIYRIARKFDGELNLVI